MKLFLSQLSKFFDYAALQGNRIKTLFQKEVALKFIKELEESSKDGGHQRHQTWTERDTALSGTFLEALRHRFGGGEQGVRKL